MRNREILVPLCDTYHFLQTTLSVNQRHWPCLVACGPDINSKGHKHDKNWKHRLHFFPANFMKSISHTYVPLSVNFFF